MTYKKQNKKKILVPKQQVSFSFRFECAAPFGVSPSLLIKNKKLIMNLKLPIHGIRFCSPVQMNLDDFSARWKSLEKHADRIGSVIIQKDVAELSVTAAKVARCVNLLKLGVVKDWGSDTDVGTELFLV